MVKRSAFLQAAGAAGLGIAAGCFFPSMACFALGFTADTASLRSSAGCRLPVVAQRFSLSLATDATHFSGGAGSSFPLVGAIAPPKEKYDTHGQNQNQTLFHYCGPLSKLYTEQYIGYNG